MVGLTIVVSRGTAQQYQGSRAADGPFAVKVLGIPLNEGSSLQRERILLNIPSCPVQIVGSTLTFDYKERGFQYKVRTTLQAQQPITAVEIRHILYDVFGDHMNNLSNTEAKDLNTGEHVIDGIWNTLRENDLSEHLTTVSYVARVRLADGKVWTFQLEPLLATLRALNLEQKIEVEDRPARR